MMKKIYLTALILLTILLASCGDKPEVFVMGTANFNGDFYDGWTNTGYDSDIKKLVWGYGLLASTMEGELVDSPLVEEKNKGE